MKFKLHSSLVGIICVGLSFSAIAKVDVPQTSLTKSCKPLINKNLKIPKPPLRGLKERIQKRLMKGMERLADSKYQEAIDTFNAILESTESAYVKAIVYQNLAAAYSQQGQYKQSLPYFKNALKYADGNMPHERVQALRYNLAALLYQVGNKKESIALLKEWIRKSNVDDPKVYILLSVLYVQENRYRDALCPAYFATKTTKKPKKEYFNNLMAIHYELKDSVGTAAILKKMVEYFPNEKTYWGQLSAVYSELDKFEEALFIKDLQYILGQYESESDYKMLSSLYAYADLPYDAAKILQEGIEKGIVKPEKNNWQNIARNYQVAYETEKAIYAWKKTAELSDDGKPYEYLAMLYTEKDDWRKVIEMLNKGLAKGNLEDKALAYVNKGVAQINLGKCSSGINTLKKATKYKSMRSRANAWIAYAEEKKKNNKCN